MPRYSLAHLADQTLACDLSTLVARDRTTTAELLAHIAEFDERKLYLPAAYPSMHAYCVGELRMSEDCAAKRIQAARAARRFPAIFEAVAEGRLHLSGVVLLAPHLTEDTAEELLSAAADRTKAEIERLLAARFPRADVLAWVESIPASSVPQLAGQHAPGQVEERLVQGRVGDGPQHAPGHVQSQLVPGCVDDRSRVKPLGPQSFAVQFTLSGRGHDRLRYAQELLGHQIPSCDIAAVFERALEALIPQLEQRKFAATSSPRRGQPRGAASTRHIPADVRRTVWERDGGQCTFVSATGRRCPARTRLEFDHIEAYARGGEVTVSGIQLRCRAHNEYAAEQTFGAEFMRHKRVAAAEARADAKERAKTARDQAATESTAPERAAAAVQTVAAEQVVAAEQAAAAGRAVAAERTGAVRRAPEAERARELDVVPWLRQLGFRADEARRAAGHCDTIPNAPLEERVRVALSFLGRARSRGVRRSGNNLGTAA